MKRYKTKFSIFIEVIKFTLASLAGIFLVGLIFPEYITTGSTSPELKSLPKNKILDMHTHVAGLGYGSSGCFVNKDLKSSYKKYFYLWAFGVNESELKNHGDSLIVEKLSAQISNSKFVSKAIVLALDGVYDDKGKIKKEDTQIYVPNEFVLNEVKKHKNLVYGASINPYRKDAIKLLKQAKKDGALLVKWIPSIMHIDPADKRIIPFYDEMVKLNIPLLTHTGNEKSFHTAIDEYADPEKLWLPLELGVTVIAAHIATTGKVDGQEMIDRLIPMFKQYPDLYADISSLTQINKIKYVKNTLQNNKIENRLLHGSDWPLQFFPVVSPLFHFMSLSIADMQFIRSQENVFDRDILLKKALGVSDKTLNRSNKFFGK